VGFHMKMFNVIFSVLVFSSTLSVLIAGKAAPDNLLRDAGGADTAIKKDAQAVIAKLAQTQDDTQLKTQLLALMNTPEIQSQIIGVIRNQRESLSRAGIADSKLHEALIRQADSRFAEEVYKLAVRNDKAHEETKREVAILTKTWNILKGWLSDSASYVSATAVMVLMVYVVIGVLPGGQLWQQLVRVLAWAGVSSAAKGIVSTLTVEAPVETGGVLWVAGKAILATLRNVSFFFTCADVLPKTANISATSVP
jgi:hypothetical protein